MKKITIEQIKEELNKKEVLNNMEIIKEKFYGDKNEYQTVLNYYPAIKIYEVLDGWVDNNMELIGYYTNKKYALSAFKRCCRNGHEI